MNKLFKIGLSTLMCVVLAACGTQVEVQPAERGKVLTSNGFQEGVIPPSRFKMNAMCFRNCDRLYLVPVSDNAVTESMKLLMPQDQLVLSFDIRATMTIDSDAATLDKIYEKIPAATKREISYYIDFGDVYKTYAQPLIRTVARNIVSQYSINQVAENREAISDEVEAAVLVALADTPITLKMLSIADIQFPDVITTAKEAAKEREIAIEGERAQALIDMVKKENDLKIAVADQAIRLTKAETIKLENEIVSKSVTPQYLAYRRLEVQEALANSNNKAFIPIDFMSRDALSTGVANAVFANN